MKPMLAQKYDPHKVKFPALISPKLDGIRCLVEFGAGGVKLWSRDAKPILSVDHIISQLQDLRRTLDLPDGLWLDGELFTQELSFQVLNGTCRRQYTDERAKPVTLFLFDVAKHPEGRERDSFASRYTWLSGLGVQQNQPYDIRSTFGLPRAPGTHYNEWDNTYLSENVVILQHVRVIKDHQVQTIERLFVEHGLEGAMVRTDVFDKKAKAWRTCGYETEESGHSRRCWGLQKVKTFSDEEFVIQGVYEERDLSGRPKGRAAGFVMQNNDGKGGTFQCSGLTDEMKAEVWENPNGYVGEKATVKFFGRSDDGTPRHPNFKALRPAGQMDAAD